MIFQLLHEAGMGLVNSTFTIESTNTTDVKSDLLIAPYTGYKRN